MRSSKTIQAAQNRLRTLNTKRTEMNVSDVSMSLMLWVPETDDALTER